MTQKLKRLPGSLTKEEIIDEIIRVNHAGEYGAQRIYQGQLAILNGHKKITQMLEQELEHLEFFENEMKDRKVRPTVLSPIWHFGGFALGAITALMGEKAAMACTVAVEEVIGEHYQSQVESLQSIDYEKNLSKKIEQFKNDELAHRDEGLNHGAEQASGYLILKSLIKSITKSAIFLSKKI